MKIVHIISGLGIGGAQTLLFDIVRNLKSEFDADICVITIDSGEYMEMFRNAGINVIDISESGLINPRIYPKLKRVLTELTPDVVHTHLHKADFYGRLAAKSVGVKGIFSTCHNYSTSHKGANQKKLSVFDKIDNYVAESSKSRVIAISKIVEKYLVTRSKYFSRNTELIYNGINVEQKSKKLLNQDARIEFRKKYGLAECDKVILIMGRLEKQKGHLGFLRNINEVLTAHDDLKILILGDGSLRNDLENYVAGRNLDDKVKFAGFVPDSEPFVEISDIVAVPSLWEAFGLAAIEGMIKGKIVVASDVGGLSEIVTDRVNGFLYDVNSKSEIMDKMQTILKNEHSIEVMKENAVLEVTKRFNAKVTSRRYYQEYCKGIGLHTCDSKSE